MSRRPKQIRRTNRRRGAFAMYAMTAVIGVVSVTAVLASNGHVETVASSGELLGFSYDDQKLVLHVRSPEEGSVTLYWQGLNDQGRYKGNRKKVTKRVNAGVCRLEFKTDLSYVHRVSLAFKGRTYNLFTNRGIWYASSNLNESRYEFGLKPLTMDASDVVLAIGYKTTAAVADGQHVMVGRTLGRQGGRGVPVNSKQALVLLAGGTIGPAKVTLTQRVGKTSVEYLDYELMLHKEMRRYVLPLSRFEQRVSNQKPLRTIYAVSVRSERPGKPGDVLDVAMIGRANKYPMIAGERIAKGTVYLRLKKGSEAQRGEVFFRDAAGKVNAKETVVKNGSVPLDGSQGQSYWLCFGEDPMKRICDPPDAPRTSYMSPPGPGGPVVIDRFDTGISVNANRQATKTFVGTSVSPGALAVDRSKGTLHMVFTPSHAKGPDNYAGYLTPLPKKLPKTLSSVAVTLKGDVPVEGVKIGLIRKGGQEVKIRLAHYTDKLGKEWRRIVIPLEAFRATLPVWGKTLRSMGRIRALTVTMDAGEANKPHLLEIGRVELLEESSILNVARFEEPMDKWLTAMGGTIRAESGSGAWVDVTQSKGKHGKGIRVSTEQVGGKAYALVSLGLGQTDASKYKSLVFWAKGGMGGEHVSVYLNDGKRKKKVELGQYMTLKNIWQRVEIPLEDFGRVRKKGLLNLFFAWEDQPMSNQTVYFDEVQLIPAGVE
ncbi:MAG: hypothetical protein GY854_13455 [Deltaproteobacteria bacterium]|nr:hypothetical protein [Deltaproteobacteria bacterium]